MNKKLLANVRNILIPTLASRIKETNYEGQGEKDAIEFTHDMTEIFDLAERQLSAQPRWIPVSERLPDNNGRYLVTRGLNAAGNKWNRVYIVNYSDLMGLKKEKIFWIGNVGKNDFERLQDVTAWQPLPEPYSKKG